MFPFLSPIKSITPHEAQKEAGERNCIIIDIRAREIFNQGHIPGAIWVDRDNPAEFINTADKKKMVICCCYKGVSSRKVAETIQKAGFSKTLNLKGGFEGWSKTFPKLIS